MRHIQITAAAAMLALALPAGAGSDGDKAEEYIPTAEARELHKAPLAGVEGKEVVVKEFTLEPGYEGKRHEHTGPVFVYVIEGALEIETDGGITTVAAGELYPEPLNTVMRATNTSAEAPARIVVFQVNDAGEMMMKTAE